MDTIKDEELRNVVLKTKSWLAVGSARWVHEDSRQLANSLVRLANQLAGQKATAIYHTNHWKLAIVDDETRQLLASDQPRAALRDVGVQIYVSGADDDVVARRSFRREWRDVVQAFDAEEEPSLRIRIGISVGSVTEPLWMRVRETRRQYGEIRAIAQLEDTSRLIPELKAGLSLLIAIYEIEAFQVGDEEIRERSLHR